MTDPEWEALKHRMLAYLRSAELVSIRPDVGLMLGEIQELRIERQGVSAASPSGEELAAWLLAEADGLRAENERLRSEAASLQTTIREGYLIGPDDTAWKWQRQAPNISPEFVTIKPPTSQEELDALRSFVQEVASRSPWRHHVGHGEPSRMCFYCDWPEGYPEHDPDSCLWLRAKALIGEAQHGQG